MRAAGEFTATRAMAILEHVLGAVKLIRHSATQAAAFNDFIHFDVLRVAGSLAQASIGQQIGRQPADDLAQRRVEQLAFE